MTGGEPSYAALGPGGPSHSRTPTAVDELTDFLRQSLEDTPHLLKWVDWFETNMPLAYLRLARNHPGLYRVHVKAITSFCGPDNEGTTTVVRHRSLSGVVVSVLDSHNCPGTLLNNVRNTLPQTETMMHSIDVFCSSDDAVALSVYHYCNDYQELEKPSPAEIKGLVRFAEEVQLGRHAPEFKPASDYSGRHLEAWLSRCTASYVRCTPEDGIYRMYLFDKVARGSGRVLIDWKSEVDNLKYDLPARDTEGGSCPKRAAKRTKLAEAFWIYGCVLSFPNIKVLEIACRVLLELKLDIERAHTDTIWNEMGTPNVLIRFFVVQTEEACAHRTETRLVAERAVLALQQAFADASAPPAGRLGMGAAPKKRATVRSKSWSSSDESGGEEPVASVGCPDVLKRTGTGGLPHRAPLAGWLLKQRRRGLIKFWQRRWVEVEGGVLAYSKSKLDVKQKTMDLRKCTLRYCDGRRFAFSVTSSDGRNVLTLACSNGQEQAQWWRGILAAQRHLDYKRAESAAAGGAEKELELDGEILTRYERLAPLGRGTTAKVWKVRDRETGDLLAMKVMDKAQVQKQGLTETVMAEKALLERLRHPFVVNMHCSFQTPTKICLVMDFYSGGTLQTLLEKWLHVPEAMTRFYATEIALAIRYMHSQDVMHRDLKLSNILLTGTGHVVVTDFGIACSSREADTFCGTPHYLAPEVLAHKHYTEAVDWWSFGILICHLLTGRLPFVSESAVPSTTVYRNILEEDPNFQSKWISPAALSLLKGLLQKEPSLRLSFDGLGAEPFFEGVDWVAAEKLKIPCPYLPDH